MAILNNKYKKFCDEKLMEFIKQCDTSAFNELYNRYSRRLLLYFYRMFGNDEQKAQDFLQDTFLKIVEKPGLFHPGKKFSPWIFTIANNLCKNEYRRLEVRKIIENNLDMDVIAQDYESEYYLAEQNLDQQLFKSALFSELKEFDINHRSTFLFRYQQNLSIKEISEILGCSEGTVKSRLFYTIKKLAHKLKAFNPYNVEVLQNEEIK